MTIDPSRKSFQRSERIPNNRQADANDQSTYGGESRSHSALSCMLLNLNLDKIIRERKVKECRDGSKVGRFQILAYDSALVSDW